MASRTVFHPISIFRSAALLLIMAYFTSCLPHKELVNFSEGDRFPEAIARQGVIKLQAGDLLDIHVFNGGDLDMQTAMPFNLDKKQDANSAASSSTLYEIDEAGNIFFPGIGLQHLGGLTLSQSRDTILGKVKTYLNDPIVNVRMVNFRITVLGEVRNPNTFSVGGNHLNILEALGMAGDLTNYGRRDNILVIREENGKRSYGVVNLKSKNAFESPFYQLQQNDIVYVEPLKQKTGAVSDQTAKILPWISVGSVVLNVIFFIIR